MSRDMNLEAMVDKLVAHIWTKTHPNEPLAEKAEKMTYWDGAGKYDEAYHKLFGELVPMMGEAETLDGKALRRLTKVYYRHYNDGDDFDTGLYDELDEYMSGARTEFSKEYYQKEDDEYEKCYCCGGDRECCDCENEEEEE